VKSLVHDDYKIHCKAVGRRVQATGTFTVSISGHHQTPVLLQVTRLAGVK